MGDTRYLAELLTEEDRYEEKMILVYTMIKAIRLRDNLVSKECSRGHTYLCAGKSLRFKCMVGSSTVASWVEIRNPKRFFNLLLLKDTYSPRDINAIEKCIKQVVVNKNKVIGQMGGNSTMKAVKKRKRKKAHLEGEIATK